MVIHPGHMHSNLSLVLSSYKVYDQVCHPELGLREVFLVIIFQTQGADSHTEWTCPLNKGRLFFLYQVVHRTLGMAAGLGWGSSARGPAACSNGLPVHTRLRAPLPPYTRWLLGLLVLFWQVWQAQCWRAVLDSWSLGAPCQTVHHWQGPVACQKLFFKRCIILSARCHGLGLESPSHWRLHRSPMGIFCHHWQLQLHGVVSYGTATGLLALEPRPL